MKNKLIFAIAALGVMTLSACGAGSPSGTAADPSNAGGGELKTVSVGVIPIVDVAPLYLGQQEGFFAKQGLKLDPVLAQGGAAIVPAIMSGTMDFGFSNVSSMLIANSKGLDVKIVSAGAASTGKEKADFGGVLVAADSDITSAAGLAGKKVAVNTLNNINDTTVRASIRKAGGDPKTTEFVELGFPDMQAALERGQVDAIQVVEPFLTSGQTEGAKLLASNYVDTAPNLTIGAYFTSAKTASENPDLVAKFTAAMKESMEFAEANPDKVREVLLSYTKIDEATAKKLTLPGYAFEVNRAALDTLVQLSKDDGLLASDPKIDTLLP